MVKHIFLYLIIFFIAIGKNYPINISEKKQLLKSIKNSKIRWVIKKYPSQRIVPPYLRRIIVTKPFEAIKITKYRNKIIGDLIKLLEDNNRDWASYIIILHIAKQEFVSDYLVREILNYSLDLNKWRRERKQIEIIYWKKWYKRNKNVLNLSLENLEKVPDEVWENQEIEVLNLKGNNIKYIPKKIKNLKKLKKLILTNVPIARKEKEKLKKLLPNCEIIY